MTYIACRGFAQSSPPPLTSPPPPPPPPPPLARSCNPMPSAQEVATWPVESICHNGGGPDPGDVRTLMSFADGTALVNNNGRCMRVRFRTCYSKCLPPEALIATPSGEIPIRDVRVGMSIWTRNRDGARVVGIVELVSNPSVQKGHHLSRVVLDDGRVIVASPEHPLLGQKRMQDLQIGNDYDGAKVNDVQFLEYSGSSTYNVLPSGETGVYWVNGVPVTSTIGP